MVGSFAGETGHGTECFHVAELDVAACRDGDGAAGSVGSRGEERVEVVDGGEVGGEEIVRCTGRVARLRRERRQGAHLRSAAEVVEGNDATDQAGQADGNLRILRVGKMIGSVDAVDVESRAECVPRPGQLSRKR